MSCNILGLEDIAEDEEQLEEDEDGDLDDDMRDFIVDEDDHLDVHGVPVRYNLLELSLCVVNINFVIFFVTNDFSYSCRRKKVSKKKSRQAPGVSSFALQEAHDIFGDVDELLRLRKQGLAKMGKHDDSGGREKRLEDEFEPIVLSEKYMTQKDDLIRGIDLPERMQVM